MIYRNAMVLLTILIMGVMYYKLSTSKNTILRDYAFFMKISMLVFSFVLAFIREDYLILGNLAFGGRTPVMLLVLIEIVDAVNERKSNIKKQEAYRKKMRRKKGM